jgi:hypothetical protein
MPAQLANESFRADHVRFGNSVGAVVQVLMRSDVPTAEAFFRDHLSSEALLNEAAILGVAYSLRHANGLANGSGLVGKYMMAPPVVPR